MKNIDKIYMLTYMSTYFPITIFSKVHGMSCFHRVATLFMRWKLRRFEEIWGGFTNIFEAICQNLAQNLRRTEQISHVYVLVNFTFTDVMSSNITVYSRRNTTHTVGEKWNFYMKLCNLHYIILTIWTHMICKWTKTLSP